MRPAISVSLLWALQVALWCRWLNVWLNGIVDLINAAISEWRGGSCGLFNYNQDRCTRQDFAQCSGAALLQQQLHTVARKASNSPPVEAVQLSKNEVTSGRWRCCIRQPIVVRHRRDHHQQLMCFWTILAACASFDNTPPASPEGSPGFAKPHLV